MSYAGVLALLGSARLFVFSLSIVISGARPAIADDLFSPDYSRSLATDQRAAVVGDILTVVIVQSAESSTTMHNGSRRSTGISGNFSAGSIDEDADISLGSQFDGQGEVRRTERFLTQMTATVTNVLPNGDLEISGLQNLNINGEATVIEVRGVVRAIDVDSDNRVTSNRIGNAQINYKGNGFVTRGARPGLIQRIFSFLGL